ncbi:MAG: hypothetical protein ACOYB1_11720 [Limnohabitans sp.]
MFWIAILGLALSWMMIKLGFLSATASILAFVVKLLLFVILAGVIAVVWSKLRSKATGTSNQN